MEIRKLDLKNKCDSRIDFNHGSNLLKSKRSQGVFGMSFGVIFSIILIVFFLAAAFIAIKFFLGFQKQAEIGLFLEDLQSEVDRAWNSPSSTFVFESSLPRGIEYACFINMSAPASGDSTENKIYGDVRFGSYDTNFVLYPIEGAGQLSHTIVKHIKLPDENPLCIGTFDGKISIRIEKAYGTALVEVS